MRLNILAGISAVCLLGLTAGCGVTKGDVGPFTPPGEETSTLQAVVDGVQFSATGKSAVDVGRGQDTFTLGARNADGARININLEGVGKAGTYSLSLDGEGGATYALGTSSWDSAIPGGFGTITFSTLSLARAIGTFSLSAAPVPGTTATGLKLVSAGSFDVSFGAQ